MYPFKKSTEYTFEEKLIGLKTHEIEDIEKSIAEEPNKQYSFFILPDGSVLDCRRPINITHLGVTDLIYNNIEMLNFDSRFNNLKLSESVIFDVAAFNMPKKTETAKQMLIRRLVISNPQLLPYSAELHQHIQDDEVLSHDLGWVKVVVVKDKNDYSMVVKIPNPSINGRALKGVQKDVVVDLAEIFGLNPKEVMNDAVERNSALSREFTAMLGKTPR